MKANELLQELDFLRFFYDEVEKYLHPDDVEVYENVRSDYLKSGKKIPEEYK